MQDFLSEIPLVVKSEAFHPYCAKAVPLVELHNQVADIHYPFGEQ